VIAAILACLFGQATGSPAALYLLSVGLGFFLSGAQSAQHAVTSEIYPTFARSTGVGWALTMGRFGAVCGPVLGGLLQSAGFSFSQYLAVLAILPTICAVLVLFFRINIKGQALETVEAELTGTGA
jgi:MFS family permease